MSDEMVQFLCLRTRPGRLTAEQAAWVLGFAVHEIPILVASRLLTPLGRPAHNGPKHFLDARLERLRRDEKWFARACDAIAAYWRRKNARKSSGAPVKPSPNQILKSVRHG